MAENYESTATTEAGHEDEMTWNDLTVPQLKEELSVRGLDTAGKKADLVARLEKYDNDMLAQQKQEEDNGDEFVVWNVDEDAGEEHEDRDDRDDVDFIGTSNGTKADEPDETGDADKDKDSAAEKPPATDADTSTKELEPDFTVTPSKDKDILLLMWSGKQIPVPFRDEVQKDMRHCSKMQNVMMYPVQLVDVFSDTFRPLVESAINVSTELDEVVAGQAIKGYLRLKFSSPSEAARAVDTLKEYKRDGLELTIKFFAEDDSEGHVLSKIRKDEADRKGPLITRLLYVGNLPAGIAEEALKECFPDALRAIVPTTEKEDATEKSVGYAYMEYASETDAAAAVKKYQDVELEGHKLYVIKAMTERMMSFGLLKDSLRKYWLEQIRGMEASKAKAFNKTPREQADIDNKLERMKRRIKKDNERRESLNIPVPESEVVEVAESDTEKDDEGKAAKDEKAKEEGSKAEHHSRRDERSPDRRRTSPRRRISPQRYRPYRGGSRGGYRGGPVGYGGSREGNADRLVDQLQELVGALAHRERDYGGSYSSGRGGYYDGPPSRGGRGGYGAPSYRGTGDYYSSGSRFPPKRPSDSDYPERKRHSGDDYYGGRGGGSYGSYGGPRRGGYY